MATVNPRLQVPITADLLARYQAIGKSFGVPASKVAADILAESVGVLEQAAVMFDKCKVDQKNTAHIVATELKSMIVDVRQSVADAQIDLEDAIAASKKKSKAKA
jgi:hypothetical protein